MLAFALPSASHRSLKTAQDNDLLPIGRLETGQCSQPIFHGESAWPGDTFIHFPYLCAMFVGDTSATLQRDIMARLLLYYQSSNLHIISFCA